MDPARKRRIRLIVALSTAMVLAVALVYTSFGASSEAREPSQLVSGAHSGRSYQLTGKVVEGTIRKQGLTTSFRVSDRNGTASIPVSYTGAIPDTFKGGREVIVQVRRQGATFVGEKDTLITKCRPSKFQEQKQKS
jgi:cytochrome c-type biogenesis protein CcmE